MKRIAVMSLIVLGIAVFGLMMGNDYYVFNPIALRYRVGWGELGFDYSPQYQRMGFTLRYDEYGYTLGGSVWYIGEDLINSPKDGWLNLGLGGVLKLGEHVVLAASLKTKPDLTGSVVNIAAGFGGSTSKYFRFLRGLSRRGFAAIYYQPYFAGEFSFTNAYLGMYMDTWGGEGKISADVKLDLAFTKESGKLFDFIRGIFILEKGILLVGGGYNIDHVSQKLKNSTYFAAGATLDAIKAWVEVYLTKDGGITFAVRTNLTF